MQLGRMREMMSAIGDPQKKLKVIHIAGTSGKTSTTYFMASLLTKSGCKTGFTVSPHVDSVLERIQVDMQQLLAEEFEAELEKFISLIKSAGIEPTYFELLTGFAYWYFEKIKVDYAVSETGLGGLQDATNVADNRDKICIITDIGLDHMHVLGSTVPEIAYQKAGIIHEGNQVFMYRQDDEIMEVVEKQCQQVGAELHIFDQDVLAMANDVSVLPEFQKRNWLLANEVYKYISARDNLPALSTDALLNTTHTQVPGRMDIINLNGKQIIMDGAHNEQKMDAFVRSFQERNPGTKVPVLLSLKEGKELTAVLPLLKTITSKLILTTFESAQDLPFKSIDPHELAAAAKKFGFEDVVVHADQDTAYAELVGQPDSKLIITGSFYLLGQLRSRHAELHHA